MSRKDAKPAKEERVGFLCARRVLLSSPSRLCAIDVRVFGEELRGPPTQSFPFPVHHGSAAKALRHQYGTLASVELGKGLTIGLHPTLGTIEPSVPEGSPAIGLEPEGTLEDAMKTLEGRGVSFVGVLDEQGQYQHV